MGCLSGDGRLEGGDFLPAGDTAFIGQGLRTNEEGVRQLLEHCVFGVPRVVVVKEPWHNQDQMHLDTYFNLISPSLAVLVAERMDVRDAAGRVIRPARPDRCSKIDVYELKGDEYRRVIEDGDFQAFLEQDMGLRLVPVANEDQLDYGINFLCIGPNRILGIEGVSAAYKAALKGVRATCVYFYGLDEATGDRLASQRTAWQAVHEAGGKVIVSGYRGQLEAVGDLLDLFNWAGPLDPSQPPEWHQRGHRIWNYANPQTPVEDPSVYRRNYGLLLWKTDYDGACTYCFMDSSGTPWNDFDCDSYRDHNVAYPTIDGVVGTLALDGFREGADDVKYATLLRQEIDAAGTGLQEAKAAAQEAAQWLESIDPRTADLDEVRAGLIERITKLKETTKH